MIAMVMNGNCRRSIAQSISLTPPIIRMPTKMSEAAVAQLGMSAAMGAKEHCNEEHCSRENGGKAGLAAFRDAGGGFNKGGNC